MAIEVINAPADRIICDNCKRHMHLVWVAMAGYGKAKPEHYCTRCLSGMLVEVGEETT